MNLVIHVDEIGEEKGAGGDEEKHCTDAECALHKAVDSVQQNNNGKCLPSCEENLKVMLKMLLLTAFVLRMSVDCSASVTAVTMRCSTPSAMFVTSTLGCLGNCDITSVMLTCELIFMNVNSDNAQSYT